MENNALLNKDKLLNADFIRNQIKSNFSNSYLTLISIIQGVALGLWASNFSDLLQNFNFLDDPLSAFVYPFLSISSFVVVFFCYSWFVSVVVTMPDLRETFIPFSLGVFEILPTSFFSYPKTYWLLFAIFSFFGVIAYYNTKINTHKDNYTEDMHVLCDAIHNQMKKNIILCTIATLISFLAFFLYPSQDEGDYSVIHDVIFSILISCCIGALLFSNQKHFLRENAYKILKMHSPIMSKCLIEDVKGIFRVKSSN